MSDLIKIHNLCSENSIKCLNLNKKNGKSIMMCIVMNNKNWNCFLRDWC